MLHIEIPVRGPPLCQVARQNVRFGQADSGSSAKIWPSHVHHEARRGEAWS